MLTGLRRSCLSLCVLFCSTAVLAEPQHAMTLYDEAPKYPSDFTHFDYTNPDAPKGGILRLAGLNGFDSLNPFIPKGNAADHIGLLYDTLTYHSADEPFTEYGLLAERIEKADDHSFVRFYLNPKARFNDGHPVTAEDVLFTFNTLVEKGHPLYRHYYADVAEVVVENPLQVRFDFKHSNNRELPLILGQLQILPKHWWAERDFTKTSLSPPLGSGPYRLVQVDAGRSLRYERVKDWWGKDLPVSRGLYNFDIIHIDYYRDMSVALEAFKAGQFDFNLEYSAKDWATGYNSPALRSGAIIKKSIKNHNPVGMQGFTFNLRKKMFQDPRVRQAISLLFDFEWTNKQLFYSSYIRTQSYFENSELAARGLPSEDELAILEPLRGSIPEQVFTAAYQTPISDGSGIIRERRLQAYRLLQEPATALKTTRWSMLKVNHSPLSLLLLKPTWSVSCCPLSAILPN